VRHVVIPDATHYVHLDRPEAGRSRFVADLLSFLAG
jgi:pimeloyl-ACP methyl ester carboxylesterase